jgi:CHAT domain-containing protein
MEAQAITALFKTGDHTLATDFAANREAVIRNQTVNQSEILHLATHGLLNSADPRFSGLIFSLVDRQGHPVNGFLRLHDVFNLDLQAQLVVLSACQTGLGEIVRGEGIVGLTRGFMYAGAPRVVVSLWEVDDEATATLMTTFYQHMLQGGLAPAAALRQAQLDLRQTPQWQSPYYWAAFTLQGEWR